MRRLLLACVLALAGCELFLSEASIVAPLRSSGGLSATCTGDPLPTAEECQAHGEQALIEVAKPRGAVAEVSVRFGPVLTGCRDITSVIQYADGSTSEQEARVCAAGG